MTFLKTYWPIYSAIIIVLSSMILGKLGFVWGWYIGIAYLLIKTATLTFLVGVFFNFNVFQIPVDGLAEKRDTPSNLFIEAINAMFIYYIYQAGYPVFAGIFMCMTFMLTVVTLFTLLPKRGS